MESKDFSVNVDGNLGPDPTTLDPVEAINQEDLPYTVREFKFFITEDNEHVKSAHGHKHIPTRTEHTYPLKVNKGSDTEKGIFCNKCHNRGFKGTFINVRKYGQIGYVGPNFCKCVIKDMYHEEDGLGSKAA